MEDESINATKGAEVSERDTDSIQHAGTPSLKGKTEGRVPSEEKEPWYSPRIISSVIKGLAENLSFTVLLISVIGYIVIASFGEMRTLDQFLRYIIFLVVSFILFKFIGLTDLFLKIDITKKSWFFIATYLILITLVIAKYFNYVKSFFEFFIKILSPAQAPIG